MTAVDLFDIPSRQLRKRIAAKAGNYDESKHPRDENGRWTAGGVGRAVAGGALAAGGTLAAAAAAGHPAGRAVFPGIRRAVNAARYRAARSAASPGRVFDDAIGANIRGLGRSSSQQMRHAWQTGVSALSARGHERPLTQAVRAQRGQFSAAAQRRLTRNSGGFAWPRNTRR
jgi:hypothetical protein